MLIRIFTLGFDPATARFNDEPVRDFIADKAVASISDHFFVKDEAPYLVLVVRYRLNLHLEKLRILLRLCHRLHYLPHAGYEHAAKSVNAVGKELGGWIKERRQQGG